MTNKQILIGNAVLNCYVIGNSGEIDIDRKHPAVLVLPGGGYEHTAYREGEPIALALLAKGYNAFVLKYTTGPEYKYPVHLEQAENALEYIRGNYKELDTDPDKIAVMGFSAGGHLAACLSTMGRILPNASVLCYPVITSGKYAHEGSFKALGEKISIEEKVSPNTPPTFIWHTYADDCVPSENALIMAGALKKYNIPFELHIFHGTEHGLSLCNSQTARPDAPALDNPHTAKWFDLCVEWMNKIL